MRIKMLELCNNIVREHQPQEDVDTIRRLINKKDYVTAYKALQNHVNEE